MKKRKVSFFSPAASRGERSFSESLTIRGKKQNFFAPFHSSTFSHPRLGQKSADDVKTAAENFHVQSIKPIF